MGFFDKVKKIVNFSAFSDLNDDLYDELEERLILADAGMDIAVQAVAELRRRVEFLKVRTVKEARGIMLNILEEMVRKGDTSLKIDFHPSVILFIGVNGVGKTTSIGKIGARLKSEGKSVLFAAADTFRAAAVEQLMLWADRVGVPIVQQGMGADPASVAYDTLQSAISKGSDIVIIDTAGRLHNKVGLMNELTKIRRVMQKLVPDAPHEVLLVLDASTGQNAVEQARQFTEATDVNALALTKLDGTAKGGVIIGISDQFNVPVRYIGLGEKMTDLQLFDPNEFVDSLFEN